MTDRLSIRFTSFALAAIMTFAMLSGIDTLAQERRAGGTQMSQAPAATAVAANPHPAAQLTQDGLCQRQRPGLCPGRFAL